VRGTRGMGEVAETRGGIVRGNTAVVEAGGTIEIGTTGGTIGTGTGIGIDGVRVQSVKRSARRHGLDIIRLF
jgi:hypothetical protein